MPRAQNTYFGKTAQLVQEAHTVSHFQKAVLKIGDYLIILAVALVAVIIAVALFRGDPILYASPASRAVVCAGADRGRDSRGDAHGVVGDDGGRRAPARQETGDREQAGGHRGTGGRGCAVRGQDRHPDTEQADAGRSVQRE